MSIRNIVEKKASELSGNHLYKKDYSPFDRGMYKVIKDNFCDTTPAMAARQETWNCINAGLFPDIVVYRWLNSSGYLNIKDRFFSSSRNYFGSMWWRVFFFFDDEAKEPYWILNSLNEDDFVQVLERIKLRGYPNLAKEIGKNIIGVRDGINGIDYPEGTKNIVIRHAIMDLRIQALSLDFNDSYQTKAIVEETFSRILNERIEEYNRLGKE